MAEAALRGLFGEDVAVAAVPAVVVVVADAVRRGVRGDEVAGGAPRLGAGTRNRGGVSRGEGEGGARVKKEEGGVDGVDGGERASCGRNNDAVGAQAVAGLATPQVPGVAGGEARDGHRPAGRSWTSWQVPGAGEEEGGWRERGGRSSL